MHWFLQEIDRNVPLELQVNHTFDQNTRRLGLKA